MNNLDKTILKIYHGKLQHKKDCPAENYKNQFYPKYDNDYRITFYCVENRDSCGQYSITKAKYKRIKEYLLTDDTIKYLIKKVENIEDKKEINNYVSCYVVYSINMSIGNGFCVQGVYKNHTRAIKERDKLKQNGLTFIIHSNIQ